MRTGIANDLHDDIGANLTRIAILSEVARRQPRLRDADPPMDRSLASIARIARESVAGMSDIVWAISPDRDNLGDLVRRMREHVEEVFAVRNVGVLFNPPAPGLLLKLDSTVRRDFYLIFKEAVNNAARHSGCSKIAVDFRADHTYLGFTMTDDGTGFDVTSAIDGNGLVSMRQRAQTAWHDARRGLARRVRHDGPADDCDRRRPAHQEAVHPGTARPAMTYLHG